jgi:hypothetical protein
MFAFCIFIIVSVKHLGDAKGQLPGHWNQANSNPYLWDNFLSILSSIGELCIILFT